MSTRKDLLAKADAILKANPEPKNPPVRNYRGTRPAMNWLKKHDEADAAAFWLIARDRLPPEAANDNNVQTKGQGVDRRKDGKPRGPAPAPRSIESYLALPGIQPRLGDAESEPTNIGNWDRETRGITIKPQGWLYPDAVFTERTRFGFCAPAIAPGAIFLGAASGLGQAKLGKRRGDVRRVDEAERPKPPEEVDTVIEVVLSGGNVADVGRALGATGGYADRRGGAALLAAGRWATEAIAA